MYAILETLIDALRLMTFQPLRHDIHRTRPERQPRRALRQRLRGGRRTAFPNGAAGGTSKTAATARHHSAGRKTGPTKHAAIQSATATFARPIRRATL